MSTLQSKLQCMADDIHMPGQLVSICGLQIFLLHASPTLPTYPPSPLVHNAHCANAEEAMCRVAIGSYPTTLF